MTKREYLLLVAIASLFGMLGGYFAGRLYTTKITSPLPKVIKAEAFYLIDKNGTKLGSLETVPKDNSHPFGGPQLRFFDGKGIMLAQFGLMGDPTLTLSGKDGKERLGLYEDGILILDDELRTRIAINYDSLNNEDVSHISISDKYGKNRAILGNAKLLDEKSGTELKRPESSLILFSPDGKIRWEASP